MPAEENDEWICAALCTLPAAFIHQDMLLSKSAIWTKCVSYNPTSLLINLSWRFDHFPELDCSAGDFVSI